MPIPVGYRVLVKIEQKDDITAGGIIIPKKRVDMDTEASEVGLVVAVGKGAYKGRLDTGDDPWCKVGDRVYFARYHGRRITLQDPEDPQKELIYRMMNDEDILGLVEENDKFIEVI